MRTANKPRLAKLQDADVFTPAFEGVQHLAQGAAGLLGLKLKVPQARSAIFRAECSALLHWVRTGAVTEGHDPKRFMHDLVDVLYRGQPPSASLEREMIDTNTPLMIVLVAGLARETLEKNKPVPVVPLAALASVDRSFITKLIQAGTLKRTSVAPERGRRMDAPIVPSDARRWLTELEVPGFETPVKKAATA
jgi:hypothetical protein